MNNKIFYREIFYGTLWSLLSIALFYSCSGNSVTLGMDDNKQKPIVFGQVDDQDLNLFKMNFKANVGSGLEELDLNNQEHFALLCSQGEIPCPVFIPPYFNPGFSGIFDGIIDATEKIHTEHIGIYRGHVFLCSKVSGSPVYTTSTQYTAGGATCVFNENEIFFKDLVEPFERLFVMKYEYPKKEGEEGKKEEGKSVFFGRQTELVPVFIANASTCSVAFKIAQLYKEKFGKKPKCFLMHPILEKTSLENGFETIVDSLCNGDVLIPDQNELFERILQAYNLQRSSENADERSKDDFLNDLKDENKEVIACLKRALLHEGILEQNLLPVDKEVEGTLTKENCFIVTSATPEPVRVLPLFLMLKNVQPLHKFDVGNFEKIKQIQEKVALAFTNIFLKIDCLVGTNGLSTPEQQNPYGDRVSHTKLGDHYIGQNFDIPEYAEGYNQFLALKYDEWINPNKSYASSLNSQEHITSAQLGERTLKKLTSSLNEKKIPPKLKAMELESINGLYLRVDISEGVDSKELGSTISEKLKNPFYDTTPVQVRIQLPTKVETRTLLGGGVHH